MPIRCIDPAGNSIHAFDFDAAGWAHLKKHNKLQNDLRTPCCASEVILRRSKLGTQHFVHKANPNCNWSPETEHHLSIKRSVIEAARQLGWNAQAEVPGQSEHEEPWQADVLLEQGNVKIAVEVQWSRQSDADTQFRQLRYRKSGVRGLWLFRQKHFPTSKSVPAVRVQGDPQNGYNVYVPTGYDEQQLSLSDFVRAALTRKFRFGIEVGSPALAEVYCGTLQCWRCKKPTNIISEIRLRIGPHEFPLNLDDLTEIPEIATLASRALPKNVPIGRIAKRYSKTMGYSYLSNGCIHCDSLIGAMLQFNQMRNPAPLAKVGFALDVRVIKLLREHGHEPGWGVYD
jgi:Competence protein CoiA-like family